MPVCPQLRSSRRCFLWNRLGGYLEEGGRLLLQWLVELGNVGSGREREPKFVVLAGFLVILGNPLADLRSGDPNDGVGSGVVVGLPAENFHTQRAFLQRVFVPRERSLDHVAKNPGEAPTMTEKRTGQQPLQLFVDGRFFLFAQAGMTVRRWINQHLYVPARIIQPANSIWLQML